MNSFTAQKTEITTDRLTCGSSRSASEYQIPQASVLLTLENLEKLAKDKFNHLRHDNDYLAEADLWNFLNVVLTQTRIK